MHSCTRMHARRVQDSVTAAAPVVEMGEGDTNTQTCTQCVYELLLIYWRACTHARRTRGSSAAATAAEEEGGGEVVAEAGSPKWVALAWALVLPAEAAAVVEVRSQPELTSALQTNFL